MKIFTIGYEGTTVPELIAALKSRGVSQVIDVRALPLSRRPGFSKSPLKAALEEAGIAYVHLKALGTPAEAYKAAAVLGKNYPQDFWYRQSLRYLLAYEKRHPKQAAWTQ